MSGPECKIGLVAGSPRGSGAAMTGGYRRYLEGCVGHHSESFGPDMIGAQDGLREASWVVGNTPAQVLRRPDCIGTPQHDIGAVPGLLTYPQTLLAGA